jgi:transcriptional regulator with XRE-family HTH domain
MDDQRLGSGLRAMRIRRKLRQRDLSFAAGVPRGVVALIEHGRLDEVAFGQIRAVARALDARFEGLVRWQGGDLDRLTNRGHAQMHEAMARWFAELKGWQAVPEVSFNQFGERGTIDILAWHASTGIVLVVELKTAIVDINNLMSTMDKRRRLALKIASDLGWKAEAVATWVVVAAGRSNDRALAEHATVLRTKFPGDGRSMRRWLARPAGDIAALSFLPKARLSDLGRDARTPRRISARSSSAKEQVLSVRAPSEGAAKRAEPRIGVAFRD